MQEWIDCAILESVPCLTIENVTKRVLKSHPEIETVDCRDIEMRIDNFLYGRDTLNGVSAGLTNRAKWTPIEELMSIILSNRNKTSEEITADIEKHRHLYGYFRPFASILSQIVRKKSEPVDSINQSVNEIARYFAQTEHTVISSTFSPEELEHAGVDPATFAMWRDSLSLPSAPRPTCLPDLSSGRIRALCGAVEPILEQKTATLAALILSGGVCQVAKKNFVIGTTTDCDLDLNLIGYEGQECRFILMLKSDLWFYCENLTETPITVNGSESGKQTVNYLPTEAIIKVGNIVMMLRYNMWMMERLRSSMLKNTV